MIKNTGPPEMDMKTRLKQLIVRLGDISPDASDNNQKQAIQSQIEKIQSRLLSNLSEHRAYIISLIVESSSVMFVKANIYATVVALVNKENLNAAQASKEPTFAESVIEKTLQSIHQFLTILNAKRCKNLLIFLGELLNVGLISQYNFLTLLYDIFKFAEKTTGLVKELVLYLGISTLPFVMQNLSSKLGLEFKNLLDFVENILKKRDLKQLKYQLLFKGEPFSLKEKDFLLAFFLCLSKCSSEKEFDFSTICRVSKLYAKDLASITALKTILKIDLEICNRQSFAFLVPAIFILEEELELNDNQRMMDVLLYRMHVDDCFAMFSQITEIMLIKMLTVQPTFNLSSAFVDLLIQEMIRGTKIPPVFYINLLRVIKDSIFKDHNSTTSKDDAQGVVENEKFESIKDSLHKILAIFIKNIDLLGIQYKSRLCKFIALYINNFRDSFFTAQFIDAENEEEQSPRKNFCREILIILQNLNFDLKDVLKTNAPLKSIMPTCEPENNCDKENYIYYDQYKILEEVMTKNRRVEKKGIDVTFAERKINEENIEEELNLDIIKAIEKIQKSMEEKHILEILIKVFLATSYKTITHFMTRFKRIYNHIKGLINTESAQIDLLDHIYDFWKKSPLHVRLIIIKFVNEQILQPGVVFEWIIGKLKVEQALLDSHLFFELSQLCMSWIIKSDAIEADEEKDLILRLILELNTTHEEDGALYGLNLIKSYLQQFKDLGNKFKDFLSEIKNEDFIGLIEQSQSMLVYVNTG